MSVRPPLGLRASRLEVGDREVLVLSWPVGSLDPLELLTPAEREVAGLLLLGRGTAEIARLRRTSQRTVRKQVETLYDKLDVGSRGELASRMGMP